MDKLKGLLAKEPVVACAVIAVVVATVIHGLVTGDWSVAWLQSLVGIVLAVVARSQVTPSDNSGDV